MSDVLSWTLELVDRLSPNAGKAARAALETEKGLVKVARASESTASKFAAAAGKIGSAAKSLASGVLSRLADVMTHAAGNLLSGAIEGGAHLAKSAVEFGVDALVFKDNILDGFQTFLGSKSAAEAAYAKVLDMAQVFHESPKAMMTGVNTLLRAGFDLKSAMSLVQTALDIKSLGGGNVEEAIGAFVEIQHAAQITTKQLKMLGGGSDLGAKRIIEALGAMKGIDTTTVQGGTEKITAMLAAGQIKSEEVLAATQRGVMKLGGVTTAGGKAAEDAHAQFEGLLAGLKNLPEQYMLRMSVSDGPIKGALQRLNDTLNPDSPTGRKIIAFLDSLATKFTDWLSKVDLDKLIKDLGDVASTLPAIGSAIGTIGSVIGTTIVAFATLGANIKYIWNDLAALRYIVYGLAAPFVLIGAVIAAFSALVLITFAGIAAAAAALAVPFVAVGVAIYDMVTAVADAIAGGASIGQALIDGIVAGIKGAVGTLKGAWNSAVSILPDTVATKLQIHSPSKVMERLGKFTVLGFQQGINDNAGGLSGAASGLAYQPATVTASGLAAASAAGGGSAPHIEINITISSEAAASGDKKELANEIARTVRREVEAVFDGAAREAGEAA